MAEPRRTFGPVVLVGLTTGLLTAIGGNKPWALARGGLVDGLPGDTATAPLVAALGFVVLASWGVLLVTRGRVRRAIALLTLLAAIGCAVVAVDSWLTVAGSLRDTLAEGGVPVDVAVDRRAWAVVSVLASLLGVLAAAAALRWAPTWPAMGTRYDAPGAAGAAGAVDETVDPTSLDLWRALDQGQDPTVRPDARSDP